MKEIVNENQRKYIYWLMCFAFAVVVLIFLGEKGPLVEADTHHFINPTEYIIKSYPLYTAFLKSCCLLFGENVYLVGVFLIQSVLAFVTSFALTEFLRKYFALKYVSAFIVFACSFLPYTYPLPESMANHHILTEGIAFPLFTLYMLYVLKVFLNKECKWMLIVAILTVLIILSRSQLLLLFPVYGVLWGIIALRKIYTRIEIRQRKVFWSVLIASLGIICIIGITLVAKLIGNNSINHMSQLTAAVSGRVLCVIDEEDRELFEGEEQALYDYIFREIDENKGRYPYFREGLSVGLDIAGHTNGNTYALGTIVSDFYKNSGDFESKNMEQTKNTIISKLFVHHLIDYFYMTVILIAYGLTMAVFICPFSIYTLCHLIALMIYIAVGILLWYANHKLKMDIKYSIPILMTLLLSVCIIVITNIIFYGQQRYVVYTFGCFYLSLFILLIGIYRTKHS